MHRAPDRRQPVSKQIQSNLDWRHSLSDTLVKICITCKHRVPLHIVALGSLRWWAQQLCDESLSNKGLKSTGCILVIFLYKNVAKCLCHSAIKLQVHNHLLRSFWIYNFTLWGSGWTLNANSQCKFQFNVNVDDRVAADIFAIFTKLTQTAHGYNNFGCATVTKHCFY